MSGAALTNTLIAVTLGTGVAKGYSDEEAGRAQAAKARAQAMENEVAITEQIIQRQDKLRKVMGAQIAQGAAQGIAPTSASFKVIQQESINAFAKDRDALTLELDIENANLQAQARNAETAGFIKGLGDIFGTAGKLITGFGLDEDADEGMPSIFGSEDKDIAGGGV